MNVFRCLNILKREFYFICVFVPVCLIVVGESFVVGFEPEVTSGVYSDDYWQVIRRESYLSFPSGQVC